MGATSNISRWLSLAAGRPLHACRLCEKLGMTQLIIPPGAGVGSAIGFLKAPFSYEATRGLFQSLADFDAAAVNAALSDLVQEASAFVQAGAQDAPTTTRLTAFMRYAGQGWEIPVVLPYRTFLDEDRAVFFEAFEEAYRALFGRVIDGLGVEITNWSLVVSTLVPAPDPVAQHSSGTPVAATRKREFYDAALRKIVRAQEVERAAMTPGVAVDGPAIIVESETTTIVTSAFRAIGQGDGSLRLIHKEAAA